MKINGGIPLKGTIRTQGAKNAALPVMAVALLLRGQTLTLDNVPDLDDINTMIELLKTLGVDVEIKRDGKTSQVIFNTPEELKWEAPDSLVRKMRASSLVLGPLLANCGKVSLPLPGGCSIGSRPIDLHLKGLKQMGAEIEIQNGVVHAHVKGKLRGRRIYLDFPSVGATENLMMAASLASGETIIENIAREPEIDNLAAVLRCIGVPVELEGTGGVRIKGIDKAHSGRERVIPDRIEACTYILAGVMTNGHIKVEDVVPSHIDAILAKMEEAGAKFAVRKSTVEIFPSKRLHPVSIKTMPYPGFPTDSQPQMAAALSLAGGVSTIEESVFQARFLYAQELNRMGADIQISRDVAIIRGVAGLQGAPVKATDLRAGAALIIAGLAAKGETRVEDMVHVWRGYEAIDKKLRSLGAQVELVEQ
ncbi:MAG: UDP-N-acetylglucosamine 1-carboxyvinyltransferase [Synergistaceae bacterium]|nr:UDP-N-acetylglucosamine 1-carboxyvinyltransferase [Synergistaceae bacterium]MBQ9404153.1 UDP-N-acetylglucosamine 1-carboxyvinyltransferase [Synergistaceae bacterium]MBQ9596258.1 UDP-N-acetylglucosamine 1-carboxyvinyltransferase [Synergistaceae bacterium]